MNETLLQYDALADTCTQEMMDCLRIVRGQPDRVKSLFIVSGQAKTRHTHNTSKVYLCMRL
jgi:hypothetical protein